MIGKAIGSILSNDAELVALVGTRIFPIIMEANTVLPAVVFNVTSVTPIYTKTGWEQDEAKFNVTTISTTYKESITIAFKVRKALELKFGTYSSVIIKRIYMNGMAESYDQEGESFVQVMNFETIIDSYGSY